ncbi:FF domain protein [Aspergillus sclerotialis]|uniref:FF domain protein n=1 Tax=Aspergillus sclerotialis TaxID=2070753 RepID=A0A3A2ZE97_9EURO|nr:FF domain protein [Aspergillus sclerotialis]
MLRSTYAPPPPLPPGWTQHKAPTGHIYYYNSETKQSTYRRPQPPQPQPEPSPAPDTTQAAPFLTPDTLPSAAATPYGPGGRGFGIPFHGAPQGQYRGGFRGGKGYQDRRRRGPEDRPKSKHSIPGCAPWVLVKTKLGRRFVHNPESNESFWKFPPDVMKAVVEYDRIEREKKERRERGKESEERELAETEEKYTEDQRESVHQEAGAAEPGEESDEYEEVEVTDSEEEEDHPSKRPKTEGEGDQPVEFTEEDIEYQLAAMGEDYGLDPGEYGEPGEEGWEEGAEGLPLTEEDAAGLFRDLLDDYHINPYSTWERIIEEGRIIEDSRYTVLPNMKSRREVFSNWSRDRIQQLKQQREKQEKEDPRIKYLAFLQEHATPKLYWPEFKRKYRKEPEMKGSQLSDRDREKFYRDLISRLKLSESTRKSDLSALLQSVPLHALNRSSQLEALPPAIITDLRYICLAPKLRDPLIETYIATLPPAPEQENMTAEQQEELDKKRIDREKREKALAEREKKVQEEKRRQRGDLMRGKNLLKEGEAEIEEAMRVRKDGIRNYVEVENKAGNEGEEQA